ncbi:hypothetical protein PF004_g10770 [Phytophthora fragariae]|nr:hypothetical protein PF004_g10770 [Phytophthora fragariae]
MAALRYMRLQDGNKNQNKKTTGEGDVYAKTDGSARGDTGPTGKSVDAAVGGDDVLAGEDETSETTMAIEKASLLGHVLDDRMMARIGNVGKLRKVMKRANQAG